MAKSRSKKNNNKLFRYVRGLIALFALFALVLVFGSLYVRHMVLETLQARTLDSSSMLLARSLTLTPGQSIIDYRLKDRLTRLGYRPSQEEPTKPGTYNVTKESLTIMTRAARFADGHLRKPTKFSIAHDKGTIVSISNSTFDQPQSSFSLEPERISLLGDSEQRASTATTFADFSKHLKDAVLAIEDERFYSHFGLDPFAVVRAMWTNLKSGKIVQGGSTITQQLVKNLFLSAERSFERKILEAVGALALETAYSKDKILELYFNEIFLGQEGRVAIHGFAEASRSFFHKHVSELNLAEAATLAAIIKAPSSYSPRRFPKKAKARRKVVLKKMVELKLITAKQAARAAKVELKIYPPSRVSRVAPYFVDYVRRFTHHSYSLDATKGQLLIHTSLDREYQICAENAISNGIQDLKRSYRRLRKNDKKLQATLLAIDPSSGDIRAWVGGKSYSQSQFDHVSQAKRQPGSIFKPFVYLTAMDSALNDYRVARTTSVLSDEPMTIEVAGSDPWSPQNYDKQFRGDVTLREALAKSLNVPTVYLAQRVGIEAILRTANALGFESKLPKVWSVALGAGEVSPLEITRAYSALANGGRLVQLRPILSVTSAGKDEPLLKPAISDSFVASSGASYLVTNVLQSAIERGTGQVIRRLGFRNPAAGKTGTTSNYRDAWFAGFTPTLLATVWVGYDDNRSLGLTGSQAAAPIWAEFMKCVAPMEPKVDFVAPEDVVFKDIDARSGLLASNRCRNAYSISEVFIKGTEPIHYCFERDDSPSIKQASAKPERTERDNKSSSSFWDTIWSSDD